VRIFSLEGKPERTLELPGRGSVSGFPSHPKRDETFFSYTSFTTPSTIYRLDAGRGEVTTFKSPQVSFRPEEYETKQLFATSRDGTRVPMFVTYRRGLVLDGSHPTLLYGYGGFDISLTPTFSVANLVWMEMGGVYCMVNLRGGGEYGKAWHEAGTRRHKQNVFDDCIAAAQHLITAGYTRPERLALSGRSNGGLLVGAVMTQHPELFGAVLPGVGVLDMLRFQKFTIGWAWTSDYGSSDDPEDFKALLAYSPLHQVHAGTHYPATMIVTADHDDRVVPAHSFKFAAALQAAQAGTAPILIRIETRAGHGAGKPVRKIIDEVSDQWAFLCSTLHMQLPTELGRP
jgi:prolyl oligopeptidase